VNPWILDASVPGWHLVSMLSESFCCGARLIGRSRRAFAATPALGADDEGVPDGQWGVLGLPKAGRDRDRGISGPCPGCLGGHPGRHEDAAPRHLRRPASLCGLSATLAVGFRLDRCRVRLGDRLGDRLGARRGRNTGGSDRGALGRRPVGGRKAVESNHFRSRMIITAPGHVVKGGGRRCALDSGSRARWLDRRRVA
jgi:hypothetical protein